MKVKDRKTTNTRNQRQRTEKNKRVPGKNPKSTTTQRQGTRTEKKKHVRPKSLGYLNKLNTAVRDHFASAMDLPTFLATQGTLTPEDRKFLVRQALILIEQNYVHLPLKRAMHSIDPVQRLKLLLHELEQTPAELLPSEVTFHWEMTEIFTSTHDGHTNYMLPAPFSWMTASLPFMVEDYFEAGRRKYLVSHITPGSINQPTFVEGVEVVSWNGIPMERAVLNNAQRYTGSNREAQHAHGVENLTTRALFIALPPDEAWVIVGYKTADGKLEEVRIDWIVNPALPSGEGNGNEKGAKADSPAEAALGLDLEHHHIQQMRKALFAPQVVAAENKIAQKGGMMAPKLLGDLDSAMPGVFEARKVTTSAGTFGYLRIRTFQCNVYSFRGEFIRLVSALPQNGLIIDVRGNGGGYIVNGEWILQVLTPKRIEPEPVQFINTPLNLRICKQIGWLNQWVESIQQSLQTGAVFSAGFPLSDPEQCNAIGQKYFGPVVLITDALCYSTTDFFAAGFQDHEIGPVLGADGNTGAGGANVWDYKDDLCNYMPDVYQPLPNGAGMRVAIRRGLRVGKRAGMPVEDLGVIPDERHFMTKNDLLHDNVDLINRAGELLTAQGPVRAFKLTIQYDLPDVPPNMAKVIINTSGISRLDIYYQERPLQSIDIHEEQTTFLVAAQTMGLEIRGFDGRQLVVRYKTSKG